jgi:hypothetical protein
VTLGPVLTHALLPCPPASSRTPHLHGTRHEPVRIRSGKNERRGGSGGNGPTDSGAAEVFRCLCDDDDASNLLLTLTLGEVEDLVEGAPPNRPRSKERGGERLPAYPLQIG